MTLLLNSCAIKKEIKVYVIDSENVEIKPSMFGSAFEDVKPSIDLPLIP